jgi:hypothetical protein
LPKPTRGPPLESATLAAERGFVCVSISTAHAHTHTHNRTHTHTHPLTYIYIRAFFVRYGIPIPIGSHGGVLARQTPAPQAGAWRTIALSSLLARCDVTHPSDAAASTHRKRSFSVSGPSLSQQGVTYYVCICVCIFDVSVCLPCIYVAAGWSFVRTA